MSEGPKLVLSVGKSDPKARSQLTSQPLGFAPASAEAVTCLSGEVREGSFGNWHLKDTGGTGDNTTAKCLSGDLQWDIAQEQLVSLCLGLCSVTAAK